MMVWHRWWSTWSQRWRWWVVAPDEAVAPAEAPRAEAGPASRARVIARRAVWILLGLLLAASVGYGLFALNQETARLSHPSAPGKDERLQNLQQAWVVEGDAPGFPSGQQARLMPLPDEWSRSHPGYQGAIWYRFTFDAHTDQLDDPLHGLYIERACSSVEVHVNGELIYRSGRMTDPYARQCHRSHMVPLPASILRATDNVVDMKVVGYPVSRVTARQRAGGLAAVKVGPLAKVRLLHDAHEFWTHTMAQVLAGVLAVLGLFAIGLAWVRRLKYLMYFGLLTMGWALMSGRFWWGDLLVPNAALEVMIAMMFAPLTALAIKFLLGYAGSGLRLVTTGVWRNRLNTALWLQCVLLPVSLLLMGTNRLFLGSRLWYILFALEVFVAIGFFLWVTGKGRRPEFWLMSAALGVVATVLGIELSYQNGLLEMWGIHITHFVMPVLYATVAVRLIQVYAKALQSAEGARAQLERRVAEISAEIERNFNQIAELRIEQIAEKERKRIASDLHDDLGAKLLTIVHTSDNDRISTLAREALEEMRLSVRGLTGRPMVLSDALADWRSEVVSRLGQAGIECEWRNPNDLIEEPLSSRTYVQTTRILREAVSNIIKHSRASHVIIAVDVNLEHHEFVLAIQDNGRGIPLELDGRLDRGHGMTSMKHRAKQLNGQCLVESGPGFGTVIRLTLPLETASMQQALATTPPTAQAAASIARTGR